MFLFFAFDGLTGVLGTSHTRARAHTDADMLGDGGEIAEAIKHAHTLW